MSTTAYFVTTTDQRTGEVWNLFAQADGTWRSRTYATLAVGPLELLAGDIVEVNLDHEFSTAMPGAGAYGDDGPNTANRSEHWFAWPMQSTAVLLGDAEQLGLPGYPIDGSGTIIVPPQESNWDGLRHHEPVSRHGKIRLAADRPDAYVFSRVYFKAGKSYTVADGPASNRQVTVHEDYARMTVEVRRP